MILTLYDYLRVGHVKRWHNVNVAREQTVAEHSYMVALIALALFDSCVGIDKDGKDSSLSAAYTIMAGALFHDMPEVVGGDPPTPAKHFIREMTGDPDIFKKMDKALMPELPFFGGRVHGPYLPFIELADKIESAAWITDNGVGAHAQIVTRSNWRQVEDLVEKHDNEDPNMGWYEAANHVLEAMNMPYVHKQSRITRT